MVVSTHRWSPVDDTLAGVLSPLTYCATGGNPLGDALYSSLFSASSGFRWFIQPVA